MPVISCIIQFLLIQRFNFFPYQSPSITPKFEGCGILGERVKIEMSSKLSKYSVNSFTQARVWVLVDQNEKTPEYYNMASCTSGWFNLVGYKILIIHISFHKNICHFFTCIDQHIPHKITVFTVRGCRGNPRWFWKKPGKPLLKKISNPCHSPTSKIYHQP